MIKKLFIICSFCSAALAQQTLMFTQYTFNKAGVNPAASGTDITQAYSYVFGLNRQWLAFDNAPKSNFVNFSYTIRPPRGYRYWHNIGVYADIDDAGLISNSGAYLSYALHTLLRKKMVFSIGLFAGARRYSRATFNFDQNDPAVKNSQTNLMLYPDLIPGLRLSDKKFFMGLCVRQLTINKLKDFKGKKIGGPSLLYPSVFFEYGRTTEIGEHAMMMPSIALNVPFKGVPNADATLMFYLANRVGLGAAIRNISFASAIFQLRFLKNVTAGLAYSYPINQSRLVAQHSYEIMIGITPLGMNNRVLGVNSIVRCPTLTY